MKTLKLTRAESRAYAAGERCFWRALKHTTEHRGPYNPAYVECHKNDPGWAKICPYGTPGDRIRLSAPNPPFLDTITQPVITRVTVTDRDGKWGWLVEVGA